MNKSNQKIFYGGEIDGILGDISIDTLDFILNLIDEYIELIESLKKQNTYEYKKQDTKS